MTDSLMYFAYGSNMSIARLRQRVPSAARVGYCRLPHHELRFHKKGRDGSGKCDAFHTGNANDFVLGSLFRIDRAEKPTLDAVEGLGAGYDEKPVLLHSSNDATLAAVTYYATAIDEALPPYSWYLLHVLIGAQESNCPASYLANIAATAVTEDRNRARDAAERAVHGGQVPEHLQHRVECLSDRP